MIRPPPRSTPLYSSAASDVYKRQVQHRGLEEQSEVVRVVRRDRHHLEGLRAGVREVAGDEVVPAHLGGGLQGVEGGQREQLRGTLGRERDAVGPQVCRQVPPFAQVVLG